MPKRFDCEEEPNEFMEAPCMCDCGNWFDQTDGYNSLNSRKIVCRECHEQEEEDAEKLHLGDKVWFLEDCYINGRKRAEHHDSGIIVNKHGSTEGTTSVLVDGKKQPIHYVPVNILEKS